MRVVGSGSFSLPRLVRQQGAIALHIRIFEKKSNAAIGDAYFKIAELRQGRTAVTLVYTLLGTDDQAGMIGYAKTIASRMKQNAH